MPDTLYLLAISPKGISSIQLGKAIGIQQKTAWFMAHRIRETWQDKPSPFGGPVDVDEAYVGGRRKNMHWGKRMQYCGFLGTCTQYRDRCCSACKLVIDWPGTASIILASEGSNQGAKRYCAGLDHPIFGQWHEFEWYLDFHE